MIPIAKILFDNDYFRIWANCYAHDHSVTKKEYKSILHWLIYRYQSTLIRKIKGY